MFVYTEEEKASMIDKFFQSKERLVLKDFPKKLKHRYLCLLWIQTLFEPKKMYTEKDINKILMNVYEDYVMIRRYLVDYQLLSRERDGSLYWVNLES